MTQLTDVAVVNFLEEYGDLPNKCFVLTAKENELIDKTEKILSKLLQEYITTEKGKKVISLPENFNSLFYVAMNRKHLSIRAVKNLIDNVFSGKWFSIIPNGETMDEFSVYFASSDSDSMTLLEADHDFYKIFTEPVEDGEAFFQAVLSSLGLSDEYKYLTSYELFTLHKIRDIFDLQKKSKAKQITQILPNDFIGLKSAPMLTLPAKIGRKAVNNAITGILGIKTITLGNHSCTITASKAAETFLKGNVNAQKFFDLINEKAYATNYNMTSFRIPLQELLQRRGLKDMKELKRQLTIAAAIIDGMTFTGQLGDGDFEKIAITQNDTSIKGGFLSFNINQKFLEGLKTTKHVVLHDPALEKLPSKGYSYGFARLFEEHKRINAGKPNENRISVLTLLNSAPYPLYEELEEKGLARQAGQKIIEPFIRCFDQMEEYGIATYQFCHKNGRPLTDDELAYFDTDYSFFSTLYVELIKHNDPDYSKIIDLKQKAKAAAAKRKANNTRKPAKRK